MSDKIVEAKDNWVDGKIPYVIIKEAGSLLEVEYLINSSMRQGLKLIKMERLRDAFFQSFILYFANSACVTSGLFLDGFSDIENYESSEDAVVKPEVESDKKTLEV